MAHSSGSEGLIVKKKAYHLLPISLVMLYLVVPLLATTLYAFSTEWSDTILPKGFTIRWFMDLFRDPAFLQALGRSLLLATGTMLASLVIMVPAIFAIVFYAPKLERLVQSLNVITYAMPGVIMAVGLIRAYSDLSIPMILVVSGAYFVSILPYMYQGTRNSLRTIHAKSLMEAAEILGASPFTAFRKVIVPNILPGTIVSALLSFSILFGEFVIVNLLVGGQYETVQIYLYSKLTQSGHIASAVVVCYFFLMALVSAVIVKVTQQKKGAF
jgi:putative spermidine/putrescine transport system permease protein